MSKFCGLCSSSSSTSYKSIPNKPAPAPPGTPKGKTESATLLDAEKSAVTLKAGSLPIHPLLRSALLQNPKNSSQLSQSLLNIRSQGFQSQQDRERNKGKGDKGKGDREENLIGEGKNTFRDFEWAREDQLSVILEIDSTRGTPNWEKTEAAAWEKIDSVIGIGGAQAQLQTQTPTEVQAKGKGKERDSWPLRSHWLPKTPGYRTVRFDERDIRVGYTGERDYLELGRKDSWESLGRRGSEEFLLKKMEEVRVRPITAPPRDLESIARIDKSLVFEHFTTEDAWLLGSALRNRLLPIPTPVVINISLANQNQTLFHTCTHSGVMPDNDSWVARKRKTVLRWGVSTWYMSCKFGGDEAAFRDKYGLGNSAGEYAIHGGGVPIRVTGVEGVIAVVVVSGLKQDEDHAVVVEVIRELYY